MTMKWITWAGNLPPLKRDTSVLLNGMATPLWRNLGLSLNNCSAFVCAARKPFWIMQLLVNHAVIFRGDQMQTCSLCDYVVVTRKFLNMISNQERMAEAELLKFRARETCGDKDDTVFKTQVRKVCAMQCPPTLFGVSWRDNWL